MSDSFDEFDVNAEEGDAASTEGGRRIDKTGDYHLEVVKSECRSEAGRTPSVNFMCAVLHTHPNGKQSVAGSIIFDDLWVNSNPHNVAVLNRFGITLGLLRAEMRDGKKIGVDPHNGSDKWNCKLIFAEENVKGLQFIARVQLEKSEDPRYEDKFKIDHRHVYHVHDPRVADVPRNVEAASLVPVPPEFAVKKASEPPTSPPTHQQSAAGVANQSNVATAPFDPTDDI